MNEAMAAAKPLRGGSTPYNNLVLRSCYCCKHLGGETGGKYHY